MDSKDLVVFDTGTDQVTGTVAVGAGATDVVKVASPDGQQAYVGYLAKRHLTVVSTRSATVTGQVRLPAGVQTLTSTPGGHHVWAGSTTPGRIYVVSSSTGKRVRTVNVDRSGPVTSIAFAPGGRRAWVAGLAGVSVVDVSTGRTIRFLPILHLFTSKAPNMGAVAFSRSGRYALVENSTVPDEPRSGQVTAVNARTFRIAWRVRTGAEPLGLAVDTARDIAYTPDYADDTVTWFRVRR
jgi:DNA-binding beta-propeller fold protein YncE